MDDRIEKIRRLGVTVRQSVSGASLTTFGSGGQVDYLLSPASVDEVAMSLEALSAEGMPYRVIGGGSDLLLPDEGYRGAILSLSRLSGVGIADTLVTADAGVKMPVLARITAKESFSGLEFARDIPGTVGGAILTNAGAFGQMISDVLVAVVIMTERGEKEMILTKEIETEYHRCRLPVRGIVLSAIFELRRGDRREIEERMRVMAARRWLTQPRERSAGSVFRRVGDTPAAVYIERTGLKGLTIGGAELSRVHCNFIVNQGGATTADYYAVAERVRERVFDESGVLLEYEVERICSPRSS